MRAKVLQIIWHGKEPVYSLDFHPGGLLATAGGDKEIKVRSRLPVSGSFSRIHPHLADPGMHASKTRFSAFVLCRLQLWRVGREKDGSPTVEHCTSLTGGHTRTVNCIRFSPTGALPTAV